MKQTIKLIAMDVDGTLTDGSLYVSSNGEVFKKFNVKDGMGITIAQNNGIHIAIITGKQSEIVNCRARELNICDVFQNINDKAEIIRILMNKYGYSKEEIAYIGDDINDLGAFDIVGISFAPHDAVQEIKDKCNYVLNSSGGNGAVRECIEYILNTNKGKNHDANENCRSNSD